jgi:hypothetical protein
MVELAGLLFLLMCLFLPHVFISSWICLAIGSDPPSPGQFGVESSHWKVFVLWLS